MSPTLPAFLERPSHEAYGMETFVKITRLLWHMLFLVNMGDMMIHKKSQLESSTPFHRETQLKLQLGFQWEMRQQQKT